MKLKSLCIVLMIVLFMAAPMLTNAQTMNAVRQTGNEYREGGLFFTPQVALYTFAFNFGASMEYGLTEKIAVCLKLNLFRGGVGGVLGVTIVLN